MIRTAFIFIAGFIIFTAPPLSAFTLDEAIDLALKNNHAIKELSFLKEAQESRVGSGWSPFLPQVDVEYSYQHSENVIPSFQTEESSVFTAQASYNLFNGFSDVMSLKSSMHERDAAKYTESAGKSDTVLEVKRAYIAVVRASEKLKVDQDAVALLDRQRHDTDLFYQTGIIAKNDLLKVDVELASARQDMLRSEKDLRIAIRTLNRITGAKIEKSEELSPLADAFMMEPDRVFLSRVMDEKRSELQYFRSIVQARKFAGKAVRGRYMPSLNLAYIYNRYGEGDAFEGRDDPLFDDDTRFMATASWNLFEGLKTVHDVDMAEYEMRASEERLLDVEDELRLQLEIALEEYAVSKNSLDVARKAITQAEENYRITENRHKERVATTTDLLDARFLLTRAKNDLTNALYNLHLAVAQIERVVEVRSLHALCEPDESGRLQE